MPHFCVESSFPRDLSTFWSLGTRDKFSRTTTSSKNINLLWECACELARSNIRFTWRQKTPIIQRRLDYWLVNDSLQDDIVSVDIIPSIKSDHSAITLSINGIDDSKRGPSFWKFNCSLVNDNNYCDLLDTNIKSWLEEFKDVVDKRVLWDLLK